MKAVERTRRPAPEAIVVPSVQWFERWRRGRTRRPPLVTPQAARGDCVQADSAKVSDGPFREPHAGSLLMRGRAASSHPMIGPANSGRGRDSDAPNDAVAAVGAALADRILLVEDNEDDVFLFRRLLGKTRLSMALDIVGDGETAIQWLSEILADLDCGRPVLPRAVFLDLKLPGVFGSEVLRWIRAQSAFDRTLVAVCSSSEEPRDVEEAERLKANVYVKKYPTLERMAALLTAPDPRTLPLELTGYGRLRR